MNNTVKINENLGDFVVDIEARPGIYAFHPQSASGKTLLYKKIREANDIPGIIAFSYDDKAIGYDLSDLLCKRGIPRILVIDRYDLMNGEYIDDIIKVSKNGVVLVDTKIGIKGINRTGNTVKYIPMVYRDGKLEVVEYDVYLRRRTRC